MAYSIYTEGSVQNELVRFLKNINSILEGGKKVGLASSSYNGKKNTTVTIKGD